MSALNTSAIILAGGIGSRMMSNKTKQFIDLFGKTVIERTVSAFDKNRFIGEIIVVTREDEIDDLIELIDNCKCSKTVRYAIGGATRADSAKNGFAIVGENYEFVAIHDAARCLITSEMIDKVIEAAHESGAASAVCAVTDTVKQVSSDGIITATMSRDNIFRAQTPQVFSREIYAEAVSKSSLDLKEITDDNMLVESIGVQIRAVDLGPSNIKITTKDDLAFAKQILLERGEVVMSSFRIGHGYDVHKLAENRKMIIGGVQIPHERGLLGHSDADVLVHAIMDSMLGAAGLGDIGRHFPDTDVAYEGISSLILLSEVTKMVQDIGYTVSNIDATLVLQKPKIAQYIPQMITNIAENIGISTEKVNIKATTEERLGFTGREEGVSAHAVCLLERWQK